MPQSYALELEQVTLARVEVNGVDPARSAFDGICADQKGQKDVLR